MQYKCESLNCLPLNFEKVIVKGRRYYTEKLKGLQNRLKGLQNPLNGLQAPSNASDPGKVTLILFSIDTLGDLPPYHSLNSLVIICHQFLSISV